MTDASNQNRSWMPGAPVDIAGLGLQLRSISSDDVDEGFISLLRDPKVLRHLAIGRQPGAVTRANVQRMIAGFDNRSSFYLGIQPAGRPERLGFCSAKLDLVGCANLTLAVVRSDLWGRGVATAAGHLLRNFLFDTVGIHKAAGFVYDTNSAMLHHMDRLGWVREGVMREAEPDGKGGRRNVVVFGLLRAEHAAIPPPPPYAPPAQ